MPFTAFIICLAYGHVPVYYTILSQQVGCNSEQGFYQLFYVVWDFIVCGVAPSFCMFLLLLLNIKNIRIGKVRVVPTNNQTQPRRNRGKTERRPFHMMLTQTHSCSFSRHAFSLSLRSTW
ncbi:unnamed protein product [Rotaria magnacalcarata]|uniref:G-protein coupled receptors family 1 profile domain-containing protein n=1 Tax=Rotaria magnacalcarata TaxID=392030 RepID=A0A816M3A6_9BILA|nr:unnamed protein product [Rotaria magnacalcarata]CAF4062908.1 unnamed protein product [Rotaria magnacalcarata]